MNKQVALWVLIWLQTVALPVFAEKAFYLGVGGYELCVEGERVSAYRSDCSQPHRPVTELLPQLAPNVNAVSIWITRDWQESWYSAEAIQRQFIDRGYTPVFIFYWFADEISPAFVEANRADYLKDLQRFTRFIQKLTGEKLVILNPEFNQNGISEYAPFNDLWLESIRRVRQVKGVSVGFCVGDFGEYHRLHDLHNWRAFHPSIERAVQSADFIAFQEMRALTRNSLQDIENTAYRSLEFARYLHRTYRKPTFLAYMALSSYGEGAAEAQQQVYEQMAMLLPVFRQHAGLIGFNSFHLIDVPGHQGYFNEAESHFGLLDRDGQEKGAMAAFREMLPD